MVDQQEFSWLTKQTDSKLWGNLFSPRFWLTQCYFNKNISEDPWFNQLIGGNGSRKLRRRLFLLRFAHRYHDIFRYIVSVLRIMEFHFCNRKLRHKLFLLHFAHKYRGILRYIAQTWLMNFAHICNRKLQHTRDLLRFAHKYRGRLRYKVHQLATRQKWQK